MTWVRWQGVVRDRKTSGLGKKGKRFVIGGRDELRNARGK